jgi:signal peptidase II
MSSYARLGFIIAALAFVADRVSKDVMLYPLHFAQMAPGQTVPVLPFFNLMMVWNPGISYGLFPASGWVGTAVLAVVAAAAVAVLSYLLWHTRAKSLAIGFGLIIGGALGNLADRLVYGKVADFFHFYGFGYDWYIFNVADIWVTFGAIAIVYDVLKPEQPAAPDGRAP